MQTIAPELAELAALIADPGRAGILSRLMDGRAQTASELAQVAGVHAPDRELASLPAGRARAAQGRAARSAALLPAGHPCWLPQMLEGMMTVAAIDPAVRPARRRGLMPRCAGPRTCYDSSSPASSASAVTEAMREHGPPPARPGGR